MAFLHGRSAALWFGAYDLSAFFNELSASHSVETAETTTFGVAGGAKTYITGLRDGTLSAKGLFDGVAAGVDEVVAAAVGAEASSAVTFAQRGTTLGDPCVSAAVRATSYEIASPVGDVVSASMEMQADGGIDRGVLLMPRTAVAATGFQTGVDQAASSANGGVGYLHLTANAQSGTTIVKVQHSVDNVTFTDLITFATLAAGIIGSQRVAVSGTVNRYVRAQYALAGAGSDTITVAFSRK